MFVAGADITEIDRLMGVWEIVEYAAEAFVIIGCVGEFVADFTHIKSESWRHQLGRASLIVLIGALGLELVALARTNTLAGREIALLNGIAADAWTRAATAEGTAKGFDAQIAEAKRNTADAQRDAANAKERASKADEHASKNEKDAALLLQQNLTLERDVLKLEAAASWREFSVTHHDRLLQLAKEHPLSSVILFDSVLGNPEAQHYGTLLAKALTDAFKRPIESPRGLSTCLECTGVWVCVNDDAGSDTVRDAKAIEPVLKRSGVGGTKFCTDPRNGQGTPATVKVLVGPKDTESAGAANTDNLAAPSGAVQAAVS
jgi:hypothetical protein